MNKAELVEALAKETELSKAAAGRAIDALVDIITHTVAKKQDVQLIGFGTFKASKRAARTAADPEALAILTELELSHLAERSLRTLSGGQRQLTGLAQALCRPPRVLLLDEPVSALDLHFQHHILRTLRTLSKRHSLLIIVVLHDLNHVLRYTDHVVVLHQGGIAATGIPGKVLTPELLNAVFAVQARLETCSQGILHLIIDQPSPGLSPTRDQTL